MTKTLHGKVHGRTIELDEEISQKGTQAMPLRFSVVATGGSPVALCFSRGQRPTTGEPPVATKGPLPSRFPLVSSG